jgi:hypothetical protein
MKNFIFIYFSVVNLDLVVYVTYVITLVCSMVIPNDKYNLGYKIYII